MNTESFIPINCFLTFFIILKTNIRYCFIRNNNNDTSLTQRAFKTFKQLTHNAFTQKNELYQSLIKSHL